MTDSFPYIPLSTEKLGNLFLQLAKLETAGLPADKAFVLIADTDKTLLDYQQASVILNSIKITEIKGEPP